MDWDLIKFLMEIWRCIGKLTKFTKPTKFTKFTVFTKLTKLTKLTKFTKFTVFTKLTKLTKFTTFTNFNCVKLTFTDFDHDTVQINSKLNRILPHATSIPYQPNPLTKIPPLKHKINLQTKKLIHFFSHNAQKRKKRKLRLNISWQSTKEHLNWP